ncbi:hypothetical protein MPER_03564 [Moniliophthora perniciosa FA553]|nr:hypothetical protein MPER_03564 [Moniliophthora perniciosa FA553]
MLYLQVIALSLLAIVSSNPLVARATCSPNFEGAGISILGSNGLVTPDGHEHGSPAPFWHYQQTRQFNGGYSGLHLRNINMS